METIQHSIRINEMAATYTLFESGYSSYLHVEDAMRTWLFSVQNTDCFSLATSVYMALP